VSQVLFHLKESIGESRLTSIAAFGTQSCGKSSTLNAMFDTDFAVSNNACTRGISIRLIPKSTVDAKEEFLLILDVEGIRSSERYSRLTEGGGNENAALN
jgi:predicted GTPase